MRLALLPGIWDTQCGFKGFKREASKIIFSQCTVDRFAFDLEVLWLAKKLGFTVKEIPVTLINDPHSIVRPFKDGIELLKLMTFLRFKKKVQGLSRGHTVKGTGPLTVCPLDSTEKTFPISIKENGGPVLVFWK